MGFNKSLPILACILSIIFSTSTHATTIDVVNQCSFTIWGASVPAGGQKIDPGQTWTFDVPAGTSSARIWGRTNCNDDGTGCQTGDCGGLVCQSGGQPPVTLAEYTLGDNTDFPDISLVDGFNLPMSFIPSASGGNCIPITCSAPIVDECPAELQRPGACANPCLVYATNEYCCYNTQRLNSDYFFF